MRFLLPLLVQVGLLAQVQKSVLVVSAGSGDYLMAAGGTLASLIDEGYSVNVVQIGNDENNSVGLSPAQSRLANNKETRNAARMLGKVAAIEQLETANRRYAAHVKQRLELAGRPSSLLAEINPATTKALIRAYAEELAETIGRKHGFRHGEEFNYHGSGSPIPEHIREKAKPIPH